MPLIILLFIIVVILLLRACSQAGLPITLSGGKSNLTGSATPEGGVVMSLVRLLSADGAGGPSVVVDAGASVGGYNADCTRTFACGEISAERRNGYSWYNAAPQQALDRYAEWSRIHPPSKNAK